RRKSSIHSRSAALHFMELHGSPGARTTLQYRKSNQEFPMAKSSASKKSSQSSSTRAGDFPLDNNTYNVITVIHEKSKGLEAFDQYLQDADENLREIFEEIREQDTRAIEQL